MPDLTGAQQLVALKAMYEAIPIERRVEFSHAFVDIEASLKAMAILDHPRTTVRPGWVRGTVAARCGETGLDACEHTARYALLAIYGERFEGDTVSRIDLFAKVGRG